MLPLHDDATSTRDVDKVWSQVGSVVHLWRRSLIACLDEAFLAERTIALYGAWWMDEARSRCGAYIYAWTWMSPAGIILPSVIFGTTGNDGCSNSQIRAEFVTSSDRRGICCRGSTSQRHADAGCKYVHSKKKNKCYQAGQLECKYVPGLNVREWGKWVWCKGVAERMTHFPICFHFLVFFLFQISVWNIQIQT